MVTIEAVEGKSIIVKLTSKTNVKIPFSNKIFTKSLKAIYRTISIYLECCIAKIIPVALYPELYNINVHTSV